MNGRALFVGDVDGDAKRVGCIRGVVQGGSDGDLRGTGGRREIGADVYGLERDGRDVDEIDVTVQASVEREVAEVGGHALEIARVVAEDRDGDAVGLFCFGSGVSAGVTGGGRGGGRWQEIGNVEDELVVAAYVFACKLFSHIDGRGLPGAFEVKQRAAIGEGVRNGDVGSIPAVAAVAGGVGVAAVVGVEAVRHGNLLPDSDLLAVPGLPRAAERGLQVLPTHGEAAGARCRRIGREARDRCVQGGRGQQGSRGRYGPGLQETSPGVGGGHSAPVLLDICPKGRQKSGGTEVGAAAIIQSIDKIPDSGDIKTRQQRCQEAVKAKNFVLSILNRPVDRNIAYCEAALQ